jgi:hypothetical protein
VPHCPISVLDLLTEYPELEAHVPQRQSVSRGDGTGWQPQVDQGYYALIRKLVDAGRPVWQLQEKSTGIREWVLTEALDRAVKAIPRKEGSTWEQNAKDLYFRRRAAEANLRLRYDDDTAGVRRGAEQPIRLAPVGRLTW